MLHAKAANVSVLPWNLVPKSRCIGSARSSGDLVSLRDAELVDLHSGLRRDLETLTLAGYGCELTDVLFDESGVGVEVFQLLQAFLNHLDMVGLFR